MPRQSIPCPDCKGPITLDTNELLNGHSFACAACGTHIRLTADRNAAERHLAEVEELRRMLG